MLKLSLSISRILAPLVSCALLLSAQAETRPETQPETQPVPAALASVLPTSGGMDTPLPGDTPAAAEPVGRAARAASSSKQTNGKTAGKRGKASKGKAGKRTASKKKAASGKASSTKSLKKRRK